MQNLYWEVLVSFTCSSEVAGIRTGSWILVEVEVVDHDRLTLKNLLLEDESHKLSFAALELTVSIVVIGGSVCCVAAVMRLAM